MTKAKAVRKNIFVPPPGKFNVIGHKIFNRCLFGTVNNLPFANYFLELIIKGKIRVDLIIASGVEDLDGIEICNSKGEVLSFVGKPYGSFLS